jgi:hypothetical protein
MDVEDGSWLEKDRQLKKEIHGSERHLNKPKTTQRRFG